MPVETYTQCRMARRNLEQTAWIPSQFASVGMTIKVKEEDGWDDGWHVTHTFSTHAREWVEEHERDYTRQRRASDI